jgi:DNA-binding transcriptional LysR family regulator
MAISTDMLEAFVKVADHLSVSAAAADLGMSKGGVSKRIAQLEQAVRATLFSRSTRRIALTPAGEIYLDFARAALVSIGSADERLRALRSELTGLIRLTAPFSWGQRVLAPAVGDFLATHPGIEIELLLEDRLLDLAYERFDLALRATSSLPPGLVSVPVARIDWDVVASPNYLERAGAPVEPEDLATHPCMSYWRESSDESWEFAAAERSVSVRMRGRFRANNPESVASAAIAGLGIALLPAYVCTDALASGQLVKLLPGWVPICKFSAQVVAVATPDRMRLQRNRAFVDFLQARLS